MSVVVKLVILILLESLFAKITWQIKKHVKANAFHDVCFNTNFNLSLSDDNAMMSQNVFALKYFLHLPGYFNIK